MINLKNECKKESCDDCRHYGKDFVIVDESGRKCALVYYNAGGMTLDEIGKVFGVSRERIRQIENAAIKKLRHASRTKILNDFVGENILSAFLRDLEMKKRRNHARKKRR